MGKKKTMPASAKKTVRPYKVAQTIKNKKAKREKHAKLHPNDNQVHLGQFSERKAPRVKGNFPKSTGLYCNPVTGQKITPPKFNRK